MEKSLSEEIRNFILEKIESVGHLEVLRLLVDHESRAWSAQEVAQELRTNSSLAQSQLDSLVYHRLVLRDPSGNFIFDSANELDFGNVHELLDIFRNRRRVIISFIYSRPAEKVRNLADAFKIRKED